MVVTKPNLDPSTQFGATQSGKANAWMRIYFDEAYLIADKFLPIFSILVKQEPALLRDTPFHHRFYLNSTVRSAFNLNCGDTSR